MKDVWAPEDVTEGGKIKSKSYNNRGSVTAGGIKVDTSNKVTKQIFDVEKKRVINTVELDFGTVRVEADFRPSDTVSNRAIAGFDELEIKLKNGLAINLGFIFSALSIFRGTKDSGWLETTYLDDDMRIGRGNAGTLFVLTREQDAIQP